jgi:hypothetical protein
MSVKSRGAALPGIVFVVCLYILTIVSYIVFRARFFAFCFGLAAILASLALLKAQRST